MGPRHERPAAELMAEHWAVCRANGSTLHRALGLCYIGTKGEHPAGHMIAWGLGRTYLEMIQGRQDVPADWEIREFEPK